MQLRPGQTLVEVLLALTIIVVGLVSLVAALVNTQSTATFSTEEAIATQFAREGLEAARFIRDSNWLKRENGLGTGYAEGLSSSTEVNDYSGIYIWNAPVVDPGSAVTFDFTADVSSDPTTKIYQNSGGVYRQFTTTPSSAWSPVLYNRFVTFYPICSDDGGITEQVLTADGQDCATTFPGTTEIGRQVVSTITWTSRGDDHSRVIEERIYDWRYAQS